MSHLTSEEANRLAGNFLTFAPTIGDYRFTNWRNLSSKEKDELGTLQDRLLDHGENILALSVSLKMHEVSESLQSIQRITDKVKTSLKKMEDIQKVIDIASAAVTLASAIVIRDMKAIQAGIGELVSTVKENGTAHL
jgi:hypothetical protein